MWVLKVTFFICLSSVICTLAEEQSIDTKLDDRLDNAEKIVLEKSEPYNRRISNEAPSFFSKLKSWIFPFGGDGASKQIDLTPAAGRHPFPSYGLPSTQLYRPDCNPCNKEPWIPVATNYGQSTILGFVQPSNLAQTHSNLEFLQPPPSGQYGAPNLNTNYGPPKQELNLNYGVPSDLQKPPPIVSEIYILPTNNYGPPPSQIPEQNYGPPQPRPESLLPNINYGPPPNVLPSKLTEQLPLVLNYGPPLNVIPSKPAEQLPLNLNYESAFNVVPPKLIDPLLSNIHYGPPPKPTDQLPPAVFIPQRPGKSYGPPGRRPNSHGPLSYPAIPKHYVSPPPFRNGQPKHLPGPPRFIQKPNVKARPPHKEYGPPFFIHDMKPPLVDSFVTNYGIPVNQLPNNYGPSNSPPLRYGSPEIVNINVIPTTIAEQTLPSPIPSDSYGAPVTGSDINYGISSNAGRGYLPPLNGGAHVNQPIQLSVFDDILEVPKEPIPFPNLYQYPLTPIHEAKDFHDNNFHTDVGDVYQESRNREVYNVNQIPNGNHNKDITHVEIQNSHQVYTSQVDEVINLKENKFEINQNRNQASYTTPTASDLVSSANQKEVVSDIQIVQSIPVANFLSSIEHPINLIQSPVVEVTASANNADQEVNQQKNYLPPPIKLSENPIIVQAQSYDSHPSASAQNITFQSSFKRDNDKSLASPKFSEEVTETVPNPQLINQFLQGVGNEIVVNKEVVKNVSQTLNPAKFTPPPLDYTSWSPTTDFISTSMVPPPPGDSQWIAAINGVGEIITTTTKKPKQIQIVVPYTNNGKTESKPQVLKGKKTIPYDYIGPKLSLYTQPPTSESVWLKYTDDYYRGESSKFTSVAYTEKPKSVINIKDLLKKEEDKKALQNLPFDVISLQKNIDGWTEQEYSRKLNRGLNEYPKTSTPSFLASAKNIPTAFLSSNSYNVSSTLKYTKDFYDHEPAGSSNKESKLRDVEDYESNFIVTETSTLPSTTEEYSTTEYPTGKTDLKEETTITPLWNKQQVSFSDLTKERIYVVTPQPLKRATTTPSTISFSHPPRIGGKLASEINDGLRLIFSEWPHLINNLETTTTTQRPTSPHPLFGLMDLSSYIPPPNSTIQTYGGHSKVITIVTPINLVSRRIENLSRDETTTEPSRL